MVVRRVITSIWFISVAYRLIQNQPLTDSISALDLSTSHIVVQVPDAILDNPNSVK